MSAPPIMPEAAERMSTGIPGLDDIMGGGFPARHMYLVEGEAGAGKTTLGLHFLLEGRRKGEKTLWITMSETERELRGTASSHGWSLDGIDILNLVMSDDMFQAEGQYSFFSPADVELNETTKSILQAIERIKPHRVVFDPFSDIKLLARDALRYRRQILTLREFLANQGCTAILMQEASRGQPGDVQAQALVHGYMTLHLDAPEYGGQRRRLRVHKMRGIPFRDGYHDFSIKTGGVDVYPRLVAAEHVRDMPDESVSSGAPTLDALVGGGIDRGTSLLIMGPAGVGKSTLATSFAAAAAGRGEKAALFIFDETVRAFRTRGDKLGLNVSRYCDEGKLLLRRIEAAEFSPGQFAHLLMDSVEKENAGLVVIDSLSGFLSAMPAERFLTTHLHELLTYLSHKNIVTIMTLPQHGVVGENVVSPADVSYLADDVLFLRYFEAFGTVRRAISMVKKRTGPHQVHIREMSIGQGGIRIGEQLAEFHGVLAGRPEFVGQAKALSSNVPE